MNLSKYLSGLRKGLLDWLRSSGPPASPWPSKLKGSLLLGAALIIFNALGLATYFAFLKYRESGELTWVFISSLLLGNLFAAAFIGWALRWMLRYISKGDLDSARLKRDHGALEMQVRELSQHSKEMALFGQLAEMLQACVNTQELCRVVTAFGKSLFPHESGALYILQSDRLILDSQASWGNPPPPAPFLPQACWSIRRGKPHYWENLQEGLFCEHVSEPMPAFSLCLPLSAQGGTLGLLHLRSGSVGKQMTEARQLVAVALGYQVALGLSNLKLKEILREEAIRDPVTGLFNRRFMQESLDHEIQRAQRLGKNLGVIAFDLDHFKEVNDSLGHAAGDSFLQGLSSLCKRSIRAEDIACRQGGDEFLLILPDISESDALKLAETLRKKVDQFTLEQCPALAGIVTVSAGIAMFPQDAGNSEGLQKAADRALYRAKSSGRDQVFTASAPKIKAVAD